MLHHGKRQRTGAVQNLAGFGRHVLVVAPASWTAPVLWRFWRRLARNRAAPPPVNRPSWGGQGIQRDGEIQARSTNSGLRLHHSLPLSLSASSAFSAVFLPPLTVLNRKPRKCPILGRLHPQWPLSRPFHPLPSSFDRGTAEDVKAQPSIYWRRRPVQSLVRPRRDGHQFALSDSP